MKILFFASLREQLQTGEEHWPDLKNCLTVADVKNKLMSRGELWSKALSNTQLIISVNQEVSNLNTAIALEDELAFFPPVTGG